MTETAFKNLSADELLCLPFDQFQRYQDVAAVIQTAFPEQRLKVLDVGGHHYGVHGSDFLPARHFLPGHDVVVLDTKLCELEGYQQGTGVDLPFADKSFDVVITCDVLEHIPPTEREAFIRELDRVAARMVIIVAPFHSESTALAERFLFEYIRLVIGGEHQALKEHLVNGLPHGAEVQAVFERLGVTYCRFGSGSLYNWLPMMLLKHQLIALGAADSAHQLLDRFFNLNFYQADHASPSYRTVFVCVREAALLEMVAGLFPEEGPQSEFFPRDLFAMLSGYATLGDIGNRNQRVLDHKDRQLQEQQQVAALTADHVHNLESVIREQHENLSQMQAHVANLSAEKGSLQGEIEQLRAQLAERGARTPVGRFKRLFSRQ